MEIMNIHHVVLVNALALTISFTQANAQADIERKMRDNMPPNAECRRDETSGQFRCTFGQGTQQKWSEMSEYFGNSFSSRGYAGSEHQWHFEGDDIEQAVHEAASLNRDLSNMAVRYMIALGVPSAFVAGCRDEARKKGNSQRRLQTGLLLKCVSSVSLRHVSRPTGEIRDGENAYWLEKDHLSEPGR